MVDRRPLLDAQLEQKDQPFVGPPARRLDGKYDEMETCRRETTANRCPSPGMSRLARRMWGECLWGLVALVYILTILGTIQLQRHDHQGGTALLSCLGIGLNLLTLTAFHFVLASEVPSRLLPSQLVLHLPGIAIGISINVCLMTKTDALSKSPAVALNILEANVALSLLLIILGRPKPTGMTQWQGRLMFLGLSVCDTMGLVLIPWLSLWLSNPITWCSSVAKGFLAIGVLFAIVAGGCTFALALCHYMPRWYRQRTALADQLPLCGCWAVNGPCVAIILLGSPLTIWASFSMAGLEPVDVLGLVEQEHFIVAALFSRISGERGRPGSAQRYSGAYDFLETAWTKGDKEDWDLRVTCLVVNTSFLVLRAFHRAEFRLEAPEPRMRVLASFAQTTIDGASSTLLDPHGGRGLGGRIRHLNAGFSRPTCVDRIVLSCVGLLGTLSIVASLLLLFAECSSPDPENMSRVSSLRLLYPALTLACVGLAMALCLAWIWYWPHYCWIRAHILPLPVTGDASASSTEAWNDECATDATSSVEQRVLQEYWPRAAGLVLRRAMSRRVPKEILALISNYLYDKEPRVCALWRQCAIPSHLSYASTTLE